MIKNKVSIWPTMITPYTKDNKVDYKNINNLVDWYFKNGCDGIFAVCQSSEMFYLTLEERVNIAKAVVERNEKIAKENNCDKMQIVASGHISDSLEDQVEEITEMSKTGVDAVILISNRFDIENTSEDKWIEDFNKLLSLLPKDIKLGMYECPKPYKRILTSKMIDAMIKSERCYFIKDTCCDAGEINRRTKQIEGSTIKLYNANGQTLLETIKGGADGYCGIMANFQPSIYKKLVQNLGTEKAEIIQSYICLAAFIENASYPSLAKYYLNTYEGFDMSIESRSTDYRLVNDYQKLCVKQLNTLGNFIKNI